VVFTEVGYPAADWGARRPWELPAGAATNPQLQADAYAAFLEAVWPQPWLGGAYWWKWFSAPGGEAAEDPFGFAGRPAEEVVRSAWARR
ncbi:MAG TPA: hypothetical protein VGV61_12780, partial [Thermoanaerobaculia bacterium]|nr:hypothetical protein [Thermoanaerobaculia bacterium]